MVQSKARIRLLAAISEVVTAELRCRFPGGRLQVEAEMDPAVPHVVFDLTVREQGKAPIHMRLGQLALSRESVELRRRAAPPGSRLDQSLTGPEDAPPNAYRLLDERMVDCVTDCLANWIEQLSALAQSLCPRIAVVTQMIAARVADGWHLALTRVDFDGGNAQLSWQASHPALTVLPVGNRFRFGLQLDHAGKYRGSVSGDIPWAGSFRRSLRRLDLTPLLETALDLLEEQRLRWMLPFESRAHAPPIRQLLLVLKPLQLAEQCRQEGRVDWGLELAGHALAQLENQGRAATVLLRQLFFHALVAELAEGEPRNQAIDAYARASDSLAAWQRRDPSLPDGPFPLYQALANRTHPGQGEREAQWGAIGDRTLTWYRKHATLEQLVEVMNVW